MKRKKAYVSPQVVRVKLEATQAVLSQCEVGAMGMSNSNPAGFCDLARDCKQRAHSGGPAANS